MVILKLKWLTALIMMGSVISAMQVNVTMPQISVNEHENHRLMDKQVNEFEIIDEDEEMNDLTDELIKDITTQFMDRLVQDVDNQYRVLNYKTIAQFKSSLTSFASDKVIDQFVDFYYYEKDGQLYIVPTSTPPWFDKANDYEVKRVEDNIFEVKQRNESEFHGDYTIVFLIRLNEADEPFIIDVNYL